MPYFGITISGVRSFGINCEPETYGTIRWHEIEALESPEVIAKFKVFDHSTMYPRTLPYLHTRNNVIEYNEIFHIAEVMGDANAFYMTACGRNNHFSRNYIHHLLGYGHQMAIRPDGNQVDFFAEENVIYKVMFGGLHTSGRNHYNNNIIAHVYQTNPAGMRWDCSAYFFIEHGEHWSPRGIMVQRNIFYEPGKSAVYYRDNRLRKADIRESFADYNLFYTAGHPAYSADQLDWYRTEGIDFHSISEDPLFVDIENGDLRLRDDSPVYQKLNFRKIDMGKMGLELAYRETLLGNRFMRTTISHKGGGKPPDEPIALTVDTKGAEIHYTLDGSHPTMDSPLYTNPITLIEGKHVRARAFKEGYLDLYGVNTFFLSPYEIDDTFDELEIGSQSVVAESCMESQYEGDIAVVEEGGRRCLKILDTPQGADYNPHLYYPLNVTDGTAQLEFDIKLSEDSIIAHEWRDMRDLAQKQIYYPGPNFRIEKGSLLIGGVERMTIPTDEWVIFSVQAKLGDEADGKWSLGVKMRDASVKLFDDLPMDNRFRGINWLGYSSHADRVVPYLDNIRLKN